MNSSGAMWARAACCVLLAAAAAADFSLDGLLDSLVPEVPTGAPVLVQPLPEVDGCQLVTDDTLWYLCDAAGLQLKIKTGVYMAPTCDYSRRTQLNCSALPARARFPLQSLVVTDCALPPALPLACVGGPAPRLALKQAASSLTAANVRGLNASDVLIMARPGAVREVPVEALAALPGLREFRLIEGTEVELRSDMFGASGLRALELSLSGVGAVPAAAFRGLANLTSLSLFGNRITTLHRDAFLGLESLEQLILNNNPVAELPAGALAAAPRLRALHLLNLALTRLPEGALSGLRHLETVDLSSTAATFTLGPRAFSSLPALRALKLTSSRVTALPPDLFLHSDNLINLTLSDNRISALPSPLWANLGALERLDLSKNRLGALTADTFSRLRALQHLDLSDNLLTALPDMVFSGLRQLSSVSLANNHISRISYVSFVGADSLRRLSLAHNRLAWSPQPAQSDFDDDQSPLNMLVNLEELDLSYNNISVMCWDWRFYMRSLRRLDLAHNALAALSQADMQFINFSGSSVAVDLSHNNISAVQPRLPWELGAPDDPRAVFRVGHNPFRCDCELYDFITLVQAESAKFEAAEASCAAPAALAGTALARVPPYDVTCPLRDAAPACDCVARPRSARVECLCPSAALAPRDISDSGMSHMALRLASAADLGSLPAAVTNLSLAGLALPAAPAVPLNVTHLDLSDNRIREVPESLLARNLTLLLARNPLDCDCFATRHVELLQRHARNILDYGRVQCEDGSLVALKDAAALCDVYKSYVSGSLIALGLIALAAAGALLYLYRTEIRVIMYRKGWCPWLLPAEDEEPDKAYDVFVSFAVEDEKFVLSEVLPRLRGLRVLVRGRDWEVGGTIPEQLHRSVERARRSLLVVSPAFLRSRWATEELRTLHAQATHDGRTRAVLLLLGLRRKQLDPELSSFLSLATFIRHDEPLFWDKVLYALPRALARPPPALGRDRPAGKGGALDVVRTRDGQLVNLAYVKDVY